MTRLLWIVALVACGHSSSSPEQTPSPAVAATPGALPTAFDGIAIGARFAAVEQRSPYDKACDNDPLEHEPTLRAVIYAGARPCHHAQFPDGTSVVILVENATDKIAAFGWMGGTYLDMRSGLPLKLGDSIDKAVALWGRPAAKFDLQTMHVARFSNGLRVMSGRLDQIVGFAVGDLPDDPATERWKEFDHMYGAYTLPVGLTSGSDECPQAMAHMYELSGGANSKVADSDLADCRANFTPDTRRCVLAAKSKDDLGGCFNHH
jgi:hypothetical protein